jgi:hypothetical protein
MSRFIKHSPIYMIPDTLFTHFDSREKLYVFRTHVCAKEAGLNNPLHTAPLDTETRQMHDRLKMSKNKFSAVKNKTVPHCVKRHSPFLTKSSLFLVIWKYHLLLKC